MDSTRQRRIAFGISVAVLALVAASCIPVARKPPPPPPPGPPVVTATCGMTITTDVVIGNDLTCSQDALVVGADGITIDLGGHTILGVGSDANNGVDGGSIFPVATDPHTFTVKHGTIAGFANGVSAQEQDATPVPPADAHHLTVDGVHFVDELGVNIFGFSSNSITHSTFEPRAGDDTSSGIGLSQGGGASTDTVSFNTFENLMSGVTIFRWGDLKIDQNRFSGVKNAVFITHANDVAVTDNHIDGAGRPPIDGSNGVWASDAASGVTVTGNDIDGLQIGVHLVGGGFTVSDITVSGNTIEESGAAAIAMVGNGQSGIAIDHNTVSRNGFAPVGVTNAPLGNEVINDGIYVDVTQVSVTITANHSEANAGHGIESIGGTDGGGNTATLNHTAPQCVGVAC
jgi:hypothetical protein